MEKRSFKRLISFLLGIAMVVGMIPANALTAFAASNIAGTFEGQDADIFSALGFDTSEVPEGYDAETTDNPYGRDKLPGNQVFELLISGSKGVSLFGNNNNNISVSGISGAPSETTNHGMVMTAVAAGDFDGDGLAGEVVYVGYKSIAYDTWSSKADLYMCVYDASAKVYSQTKKIGTFNPAQVTTSGGTNYSRYDWAWQNLLQVTAGDYDGDGMAEIAAYVADDGNCRVDVFKFQKTSESTDTSWRDITQWKRTWSHVISNTANQIPNMVSLASGDFNRDGVDDLAVSYGRFAPGSKDFTKTEMDKSHAVVLWGGRSDMLQSYETLDLNEGTLGDLVRVSLIAGDLDNDGYAELIATGQPYSDAQNYDFSRVEDTTMVGLSTKGNTERTITTYIYDEAMGLVVNYSGLHKTIDGSFETVGEGEGASTNWQSNNGFDEKYFSQPAMRTNAAVFKGEGQDYPTLYLDSCLYEWAEGQVTLKKSLDDAATGLGGAGKWGMDLDVTLAVFDANYVEYGAVSADMNGDGFSTLATGVYRGTSLEYYDETEEGPVAYAGHKSGYMVLGGSADGTLNSNITLVANCDSAEASQDQLSVSLAMVDTDIDTVLIEYTGEHYLTYSDPKVYAIIAAAPYFEDVDKVANYDYAWQNTTSYSIISGGGRSDIVGVDLEAGIWLSADVVAGGGKVVTETAVMYTLEWEKETAKSTEYVLSFETSQNEDSVAFFSIPTENYLYKISTPDGKGGYVESYETVSRAFTPCYQILTLDYYESIQGNYEELPQIAGTVLKSTPGDPSSYPSSTSGYNVIAEWNKEPAGVSFGNGAITQEITVTKEHTESYNMGVAVDYKLGYGGEFQSDLTQSNVEMAGGGQFSLNPTGGWATFNLEGASYSGTVTNMPLEFQEYGYYYTWKLFAYAFEFGGGEIPVVSYVVNDVSEPPLLPEDFQQDYDRTTSDKNVLTWTYDDEFSSFLLYKYYDFPVGGGLQQILEVPKSCAAKTEVTNSSGTYIYGYTLKYDDDGKLYKEYYIEDCNLAPYTEYDYAIQVERLSKVPPRSSTSGLVTVRTKAANGNPLIPISESDGEDDGKLLVYPDKTSYLTVEATGPKGEAAEDYYTTVQYQWQKQEKGAWTDIVGETSKTLTFAKAGVDSAGEYRCLVNVLTKADNTAISTYTKSVTLTHAKRISYIEESTFGAQDVSGGGVYIYAKVRNAHADSAAIPSGTITFNLTNNATGINYQFSDELNAEGVAEVTTDYTLPEGMYTVDAYYSGSYNFISCTAQTLYLSQRGSGYDVDAPASVIYGEGAEVIGRAVNKSAGITDTSEQKAASFKIMPATAMSQKILSGAAEIKEGDSVSAGSKYVYNDEGLKYYFVAAHTAGSISFVNGYAVYNIENEYLKYTNDGGKYVLAENTPADTYMISMTFGEGVNTQSANAVIVVLRRDITLKLPKQKGDEGAAAAGSILVSELEVVDGSWAECDMADGTLVGNLAVTTAALKYYNTAGTNIASGGVGALCGYYTVKSTTAINNYNATYVDGSYTVLGGTNQLSVGARYFEGKDVGTVYVVSPDYEYTRTAINAEEGEKLTQKHATGTRLVVTAVPDEGYTIYAWYINGVKQKSVSNSVSYTMLNEETTIEVQFDVKKNTLSFGTAGDEGGGTIVCSDETLTSGSVVLPNAYMTFEAVANEGYHFKEWRYTELGSGTVYDDDDSGKASSSFELLMPSAGCSVYAVFERDYYKLTYADSGINSGLTAWYTQYQPGATEGETVYVNSGDSIKGGTVVTVGLKQGYLW
ncbi:MAG: FG-GAP repeat protein, partial [Oscillospiraceae bacterium]|nr:FG-GAP repeat protein [Oscillospiraceae bacterium]